MNKFEKSLNEYERHLLDRGSLESDKCLCCGAPAVNNHHIIIKGAGGVSKANEKRIPTVSLCGNGNTSGCHKLAHDGRLHFFYFLDKVDVLAEDCNGEDVVLDIVEDGAWKLCLLPKGLPLYCYNLQYALENGEWRTVRSDWLL